MANSQVVAFHIHNFVWVGANDDVDSLMVEYAYLNLRHQNQANQLKVNYHCRRSFLIVQKVPQVNYLLQLEKQHYQLIVQLH